jgi:hypothetical protein
MIDSPSSRFDSLLQAGMLCGDDKNSALGLLQRAKTAIRGSAYEDMRRSYVAASLEADLADHPPVYESGYNTLDNKIPGYGAGNSDTRKSLMDLLQPDDFLYRPTAARYYFFQATVAGTNMPSLLTSRSAVYGWGRLPD